jgi:hypothetical protein
MPGPVILRTTVELGLALQGEGMVEGRWVDRVVGLGGVRVEVADSSARWSATRMATGSAMSAAPRASSWILLSESADDLIPR